MTVTKIEDKVYIINKLTWLNYGIVSLNVQDGTKIKKIITHMANVILEDNNE